MSESQTTVDEGAAGAMPPGGGRWRRGATLGRYLILDTVGAGGIGVVLAAYDPQLDRKVAIKVLHPGHRASSDELRERVLREARALARVVHPNIVSVYDAGFHGSELFVVMELVEGDDLRRWLRAAPRGVAEIAGVFLQAGRGLAGAHAAGLVHRDFKPDNVLVGRDGRVRVADFGLARVLDSGIAGEAEVTPAGALSTTRSGAIVGTPAYMAPEQHAGARVDERADQFAFCVALYEALHGVRPFGGDSYAELADNVRHGRFRRHARSREVPARLQEVVARGLAVRPEDRFPSMDALLAALARDPAAARRRLGLVAAAGVALAGAAAVGMAARDEPPRLCRSGPEEVAGAWSPRIRAAVESAFRASGRPYAADVLASVTARLDHYAATWTAMRTDACEATHFRGTQSGATLDLRMRCLDGRLAALAAATEVLAVADATTVDRALAVAGELPAIAACADLPALAAVRPPPADPAARARVDALGTRLVTAAARRRAGQLDAALAEAAPAVEAARSAGQPPLLAEALLERGSIERRLTRLREAELTLEEALRVAAGARDDVTLARAAVELAVVVGDGLVRDADLARLRPFIDAAVTRLRADDPARATWLSAQGQSEKRRGQLAAAAAYFTRVLAERERTLPPDDPAIAHALLLLGETRVDLGDVKGARPVLERAINMTEATFGRDHPDVAPMLNNLGDALESLGQHTEARALHERALAIAERALGPTHLGTGWSASRLGVLLLRDGDYARAEALLSRAVAIRVAFYGPDHAGAAPDLVNLGIVYARTRRLPEAEAMYRRALAIYEKAYGPEHPSVGAALTNIGNVYLKQGRHAAAIPLFARDLAINTRLHGPEHPDVGLAHLNLAEAYEPLGRLREARQALERAAAIYGKEAGFDYEMAHVELALGRVALAEGRRAAASPHLERAVRLWRAQGFDPAKVAEAEALLRKATGTPGRGAPRTPP